MKKYFWLLMITIIFILPFKVNALECSDKEIIGLKKLKNNIKIKYNHLTEEEAKTKYDIESDNLFTLNFYNVPKNIVVISPYDEGIISNTTGENITNVLNGGWAFGGDEIQFPVYTTTNYSCYAYLDSIKVRVPWYNKYSKTDECKANPDFKYCKEFLNIRITEETFKKELKKYIENNKTDPEIEQKENLFMYIIKNYYWIIIGVFVLAIISTVVIVKRRKRRRLI